MFCIIILCAINLVSFSIFAYDKEMAIEGQWRVPEKTLLLWSAAAPFGGLLAMLLCRHKIRNRLFTTVVPMLCIAWAAAIILLKY